jgi:hypothetical protein
MVREFKVGQHSVTFPCSVTAFIARTYTPGGLKSEVQHRFV